MLQQGLLCRAVLFCGRRITPSTWPSTAGIHALHRAAQHWFSWQNERSRHSVGRGHHHHGLPLPACLPSRPPTAQLLLSPEPYLPACLPTGAPATGPGPQASQRQQPQLSSVRQQAGGQRQVRAARQHGAAGQQDSRRAAAWQPTASSSGSPRRAAAGAVPSTTGKIRSRVWEDDVHSSASDTDSAACDSWRQELSARLGSAMRKLEPALHGAV